MKFFFSWNFIFLVRLAKANESVLPVRQFGNVEVGIWFFEVLPRTVRVLTGHQEGGEDVPELVLTGAVREGEGCDEPGREILDKVLSLQQTGMVAVADPVVGAPFTDRDARACPAASSSAILLLVKKVAPGLRRQTWNWPR